MSAVKSASSIEINADCGNRLRTAEAPYTSSRPLASQLWNAHFYPSDVGDQGVARQSLSLSESSSQ